MRGNKRGLNPEEDDYEEEGPSSIAATNNTNNNLHIIIGKDEKSIDKVNAMRSKHSVTEQRRRSKINERFQILRDLIPHSDKKKDMASFLLEVIEYVQCLQEKVQKYEGLYQGWGLESTRLMPWRNSPWCIQSFNGNPQVTSNGSGPGSMLRRKLDEDNTTIPPTMITSAQNPLESDPSRDALCKTMEQQSELVGKSMPYPARLPNIITNSLQCPAANAQSVEYSTTNDPLVQPEDLTIEGGTISISSAYSEGLLNTLTQALQSAGIDLSQANMSVHIDIGNQANRGLTCAPPPAKDSQSQGVANLRDLISVKESDAAQNQLKA